MVIDVKLSHTNYNVNKYSENAKSGKALVRMYMHDLCGVKKKYYLPSLKEYCLFTGEEVSIDKQVAFEECPRWLKMTEVACEKTVVAVC